MKASTAAVMVLPLLNNSLCSCRGFVLSMPSWSRSAQSGSVILPYFQLSSSRYVSSGENDDKENHKQDTAVSRAEEAFGVLAKRGKSWKRLRHVVDLAIISSNSSLSRRGGGVTDVGTDHGLLAIALAASGKFDRVVGIDISQRALQDGALQLLEQVKSFQKEETNNSSTPVSLNVDFRVGNGLESLHLGEADTVCIAGMGVNTILKILTAKMTNSTSSSPQQLAILDHLGCERLIVQPTNSRPRNLILLYNKLQSMGWKALQERIEYTSSKWYISTLFQRLEEVEQRHDSLPCLPGEKLKEMDIVKQGLGDHSDSTESPVLERSIFEQYVDHHRAWIEMDRRVQAGRKNINEDEERWLQLFREY